MQHSYDVHTNSRKLSPRPLLASAPFFCDFSSAECHVSGRQVRFETSGVIDFDVELDRDAKDDAAEEFHTAAGASFLEGALISPSKYPVLEGFSGEAFTIALRFCDPTGTYNCALLSATDDDGSYSFRLKAAPHASPSDFIFEMKTDADYCKTIAPVALVGYTSWHTVVLRYTGDRLDMYVDGQYLHLCGDTSGSVQLKNAVLQIGKSAGEDGPPRQFTGLIDYVALWNRDLSDSEVLVLNGGEENVQKNALKATRKWREWLKVQQARVASDPQRPQFHLTPSANWMNDPNGMFFRNGEFHLFYQHNPYGPYWGPMHWGHAVSNDMVHWKYLPMALEPSPDGPDQHGCFSGSMIEVDGQPMIYYTSVYPESQSLAFGSADLITWDKYDNNPVIPNPPEGMDIDGFRDPWLWKEGDEWFMIVGSGIRGEGGFVPLYRSLDLINWEYLNPLIKGDIETHGRIWECPNFFRLDEKYVLIISPEPLGKAIYFIGSYENHRFYPESEGVIDLGGNYYAPQSQLDEHGRRILVGWLTDGRSEEAQWQAGWSGAMSLPRVLSLSDDRKTLLMEPVRELEKLRTKKYEAIDFPLTNEEAPRVLDISGDQLELRARFSHIEAQRCGLKVRQSPNGGEETLVYFDKNQRKIEVIRERSSNSDLVDKEPCSGDFELPDGEELDLHIFLDRSIVEIFANNGFCLTARIYPQKPESVCVSMYSENGRVNVDSLEIWKMKSIWH